MAFAVDESEYLESIGGVGFSQVQVVSRRPLTRAELDVMTTCPDPLITPPPKIEDIDIVEGNVISIKLTAVKNQN
jgi:hypothetical protein